MTIHPGRSHEHTPLPCTVCERAEQLKAEKTENQLMANHPRCGSCGILLGGNHLAKDRGNGICHFRHQADFAEKALWLGS